VFDYAVSQEVSNVRAFQDGNAIGVYYDLLALNETAFFITLLVSQDGGATYTRVVDHLSGDVNTLVRRGDRKLIIWDYERQQEIKATNLAFKVVAEVLNMPENATPKPKFDDASLIVKTVATGRSGPNAIVYLSFYNKTSAAISFIHGPYLAVGSDNKNYKVVSNSERQIELRPRSEKQISVQILDIGLDVNFLNRFEFFLGGTKVVWSGLLISPSAGTAENR
jgi:hypothetical protein